MPDKWDSPDGQTHDESELIATDAEIALWFNRLREAHDSISRESEWEPPDPSVVLALQAFEGCINRLDAAERERDALKARLAVRHGDNDLTVQVVSWVLEGVAPATKTPAEIAILIRNAIRAHVAAETEKYRETLRACLPWLDKCPPMVQQINALLAGEDVVDA